MRIPFWDVARQYRDLREEILGAVDRVLGSGRYVLGEEVAAFEEELASFLGARFAVGVNSGTDALFLALKAVGVGQGDEVLVPASTFVSTANVVHFCGARPVFVDVEEDTLNMDPAALEKALSPRARAIIPVHFHGHPAHMDPILEVARARGLAVIEDAAQALGAHYRGKPVGTLGDIGCFSFYPTKHLGACGDAGAVVTSDEKLAQRVRALRDYGRRDQYAFDLIGYNSRLDEVQAAILRLKLKRLDAWIERRRQLAEVYTSGLRSTPGLGLPIEKPYARHVYWAYTLRCRNRDYLREKLADRGIGTHVIYAIPIPFQRAYEYLSHGREEFSTSDRCSREMLSIPTYPELTAREQEEIIGAIKELAATADTR